MIDGLLAPHRCAGRLRTLERHRPTGAEVDGDEVPAVELADLERGRCVTVTADFFLDATETGDGEAAASLACTCLEHATIPAHVADGRALREELQSGLARRGVQLRWPRARAASD